MLRKIIFAGALLCVAWPLSIPAQAQRAKVVASCGTVSPAYNPVGDGAITIDVNGNQCIAGSFSQTGGTVSNAASAQATSGTNQGSVSWLYGFNGTTWDQLQVDASKFLKINCVTGCAGGTFNNNADAVATSATNGQSAAWGYFYNGTTWDRARGDTTSGLWVNVKSSVLPTGASTSANQSSQITQETATAAALGTTADAACSTDNGTCTMEALQKRTNQNLTTLNTTAAGPIAAGEAHVGEIASNQIKVQVAQTVTAASAYASGNAIGGLMTIAGAARVSGSLGAAGTGGILTGMMMNSKSLQTTQVDVVFFDANPTGSTCTDKTAFSLATADFDKVVGYLTVPGTAANGAGWVAGTVGSVGVATYYPMTYDLASSTSLFACAITRGTPTFTATTDVSFKFNALRN